MKTYQKSTIFGASLLVALLSGECVHAGEVTLKTSAFKQEIELDAIAVPLKSESISVKPKAWYQIIVENVLPSGSVVKKGDILVWIDTEALDKKIAEVEQARVKQKLGLESVEQELRDLEKSTEDQLKAADLRYQRVLEDYKNYQTVARVAKREESEFKLFQAESYLAYANEELKQLYKMYKADGLTEDTEEIIITRAKHRIRSSELALKKQQISTNHLINVELPRLDEDWKISVAKSLVDLDTVKEKLPRALLIKREDLEVRRTNDAKSVKYLKDLALDRKAYEFKSPISGVFYHGVVKNGVWNKDLARKTLKVGGNFPSRVAVMTVVPVNTKYRFITTLSEQNKSLVKGSELAQLKLLKNSWKSYSVKSEELGGNPNKNLNWILKLTFTDSKKSPKSLYLGAKAKVKVTLSESNNVISIPANAIFWNADGSHSVKVKMAEGEPKMTKVTVGRQSGSDVEIKSGLTAGQVIITP